MTCVSIDSMLPTDDTTRDGPRNEFVVRRRRGLAIVLGAVALSAKKGGTIHRRSGLLFVGAMLVIGTTAPTSSAV